MLLFAINAGKVARCWFLLMGGALGTDYGFWFRGGACRVSLMTFTKYNYACEVVYVGKLQACVCAG